MELNSVLTALLIAVFVVVGIALVVLLLQLVKVLKSAKGMIDNLQPTLSNVETITTDIQPAINKIDPLMDRVQLTIDSVNLEMMRVDQILEDVSEITDTASSATSAVDNITNAPVKVVSSVASRVKTRFGVKDASDESAQLAEQRVAVAKALRDYEAAEEREAARAARLVGVEGEAPAFEGAVAEDEPLSVEDAMTAARGALVDAVAETAGQGGTLRTYVDMEDASELEIDPKVIAESPFFDDDAK